MLPSDPTSLTLLPCSDDGLAQAGQVANDHASRSVFADYLSRQAAHTLARSGLRSAGRSVSI